MISPHTQLGRGNSYNGWYPKGLEWGNYGKIQMHDFTDHGSPQVDPIPSHIKWSTKETRWTIEKPGILKHLLSYLNFFKNK